MMTEQPYHKYVFDIRNRKFIGKFEEMYQNEDRDIYDSWFQEDIANFTRQLSLLILNRYNFDSILDIGCGKGVFTHLLKKTNNRVVGVDISETAIMKAKSRYKDIKFLKLTVDEALNLQKKWDLIVMMEMLSYIKNWPDVLAKIVNQTLYIYISLYLPVNPIGFVKSFADLNKRVSKYFNIETEILWNREHMFILGKNKKEAKKL